MAEVVMPVYLRASPKAVRTPPTELLSVMVPLVEVTAQEVGRTPVPGGGARRQ